MQLAVQSQRSLSDHRGRYASELDLIPRQVTGTAVLAGRAVPAHLRTDILLLRGESSHVAGHHDGFESSMGSTIRLNAYIAQL